MPIPAILLTPQAWLLFNLLVTNAITAIMNEVQQMTPEQIEAGIPVEEARKAKNMAELGSH